MNMSAAAENTARILGCTLQRCDQAILCCGQCHRRRITFNPRDAGFTLEQEPPPKDAPASMRGKVFD
jgi:hypothetical protein